jgi:peptidoglycan/xylan/chitin deacetylase (PgdA/CDA1 family)
MTAGHEGPIPVLMYHSIAERGSAWVGDFAVPPSRFAEQLEAIGAAGCTGLTVSELVTAVHGDGDLPPRPVVITFDDGFADFHDQALPLLEAWSLPATVYLTTGFLEGEAATRCTRRPDAPMLSWSQLGELAGRGVELGSHTHTHPELDMLDDEAVWREVATSKRLLEDRLGTGVRSFAYPYGYADERVRRAVRLAGYESACGVHHALSSTADDRFSIARLEIKRGTSAARLAAWLAGRGVRVAPCGERLRTRLWRLPRRVRAGAGRVRARVRAGT